MATLTSGRARLLLRISAAFLVLGAIVAVVLAIVLPLDGRDQKPAGPSGALPPLDQFATVWQADLRQPITPGPKQSETVDENAAVPIQLTGTLGPGQALVTRGDGSVQAISVGETVDGVEIVEVRAGQMTVRYNGRLCKLSKPQEPNPLGGI